MFGVKDTKQAKVCTPDLVMVGDLIKTSTMYQISLKIAVTSSIFACQVKNYVPSMLKFGMKQYMAGYSNMPYLSIIGGSGFVQTPPNLKNQH